MRKKYFTLIELIIALGLASILFMSLFSYYYQMSRNRMILNQEVQKVEKWKLLESRLSIVLSKINGIKRKTMNEKTNRLFFYSSIDNSLVFTYDNGADLDPRFSGLVLAKLIVIDDNLYLVRWPIHEKKENFIGEQLEQREVIFTGIKNLQFYFSSREKNMWIFPWGYDHKGALPDFIKLRMSFSGEKDFFLVFQMHNSLNHKVEYLISER